MPWDWARISALVSVRPGSGRVIGALAAAPDARARATSGSFGQFGLRDDALSRGLRQAVAVRQHQRRPLAVIDLRPLLFEDAEIAEEAPEELAFLRGGHGGRSATAPATTAARGENGMG